MLLHIFRAESGAVKQSAAEKGLEGARAALQEDGLRI
jgi:hypothetical protein